MSRRKDSENYDFPVSGPIADHLTGRRPRQPKRLKPVHQKEMAEALATLEKLTGFTPPARRDKAEGK